MRHEGKKRALVSGSSRGIGLGIAKALIDAGYLVYINGRHPAEVEKTCVRLGDSALPLPGDLVEDTSRQSVLDQWMSSGDRLDLVVANIGSGKSVSGAVVPQDECRRVFDLNFFSAVGLIQWAIQHFAQRGGHVVAIASIAGHESLGAPVTYASAKSALLSYVKNISRFAGPMGIRINAVSPGNVMFEGSTWDQKRKENAIEVDRMIREKVPLNAFASPDDIGKAVVFLDRQLFVTGSNLIIDGGQTVSL